MSVNNRSQTEWHTVDSGEIHYTLPVRYQNLAYIAQGAYGAVVRATDRETNTYVAIKKLLHPFQTATHATRTYRELKLLMHLNHPDSHVIQLYDVFTPEENINDFKTIYFVFDYVDHDLKRIIERRLPLEQDYIKNIIHSLLRGLKFIHSAGVIHRDLKPANIGIDKDSNVTILDFGLARVASNDEYTPYVATRWWRAPEVYINWERYDEKVDIWSVGCIMAELILLRPIFPGTNHIDQLNKIFDIIGTPNLKTLKGISTQVTMDYISGLPSKQKQDFNQLFGFKYSPGTQKPISGVSPQGIDLLDRLLCFDPRIRPTAEQALDHPFFENYRDKIEPTMEPMIDEHQDAVHSIPEWKSIIWQNIQEFIPPSLDDDDENDS